MHSLVRVLFTSFRVVKLVVVVLARIPQLTFGQLCVTSIFLALASKIAVECNNNRAKHRTVSNGANLLIFAVVHED